MCQPCVHFFNKHALNHRHKCRCTMPQTDEDDDDGNKNPEIETSNCFLCLSLYLLTVCKSKCEAIWNSVYLFILHHHIYLRTKMFLLFEYQMQDEHKNDVELNCWLFEVFLDGVLVLTIEHQR